MKIQQKIDRALEAHVRLNFVGWSPDLADADRKKRSEEALRLIKEARTNPVNVPLELIEVVSMNDAARAPADDMRKKAEKQMEMLATQLPVASWIEDTPGAGLLGLATIVAETGSLDNYANPSKVINDDSSRVYLRLNDE